MIDERVNELRKELKKANVNSYLITGTDPHQSEYVAPRWRTRAFISGFTGSAGTVIITEKEALLWVDSRYFIQAEAEIKGTEFKMFKLDTPGYPDPYTWLSENMKKGEVLGIDGNSVSISDFNEIQSKLKKSGIKVQATSDLLLPIWKNRSEVPSTLCVEMKDEYAGFTASAKISLLRLKLREKGAKWTLITSIDDIAWLSNLRANDILYNPVFYSYAFVSLTEAILYTSPKRFTKELKAKVEEAFVLKDYEDIFKDVESLTKRGVGYYDPAKVNYVFAPYVAKARNITGRDITTDLKARKNPAELEGMRRAHFLDGIAFANFMSKLDRAGRYSEMEIAERFEKEREKMEGYLGPSFAPISGFREHGAMCHYSASEKSNKAIDQEGLLVLDTGSQFEFGMTDLTRTLLFGLEGTEEEKKDYTLVLKGHLALASQRFIAGTTGVQLDVLAKQYLWQAGMSFYHGTGHGVGCRLNVHEGPMRISSKLIDVALLPGMVISDEPGLYKEGRHGIRIENLVAVQNDVKTEFGQFYSFETLSVVPYEKRLIDVRYLSDSEIERINLYHKWVHDQIYDYVSNEAKIWLDEATSPISR